VEFDAHVTLCNTALIIHVLLSFVTQTAVVDEGKLTSGDFEHRQIVEMFAFASL
jgi:hypothetical protein